jgi:acetylglutamate kinase
MAEHPVVIKIGGNDLEKAGFIDELAQTIAHLSHPCILVHGGGQSINRLQERLGIVPVYLDGQRVTDAATLEAAEMMLSGIVNKQLTLALLKAGVDALGMSGVDRGLIQVEAWSAGLGLVGRIVQVRAEVLLNLCAQGVVPVISPISMGPEGRYNVNADHAASAIAAAIQAPHAAFVTNVPGVRIGPDVVSHLSAVEARDLIAQGVITGGMIPKVNAALDAVASGVHKAIITDLRGLSAGTGTEFVA